MKRFLLAMLVLSLAQCGRPVRADVPRTIPFQAFVSDASNSPIDGTRSVTFTLYDDAGVSQWTETKDMTITRGLLSTLLGDTAGFPLGFSYDQAHVLGIRVGTDTEMTPRLHLGAVPFAIGLALPYAGGSSALGVNPAFSIRSSGNGGAGYFEIDNALNARAALYGKTNGTGDAVNGYTTGSGIGVYGIATGTGDAGHFRVLNDGSPGDAVFAETNGSGMAVYGYTTGTGRAGNFQINRNSSTASALEANTNGLGHALYSVTTGTGRAGFFEIDNQSSISSALAARTNGTGLAGYFQVDNPASRIPAIYGTTNGGGDAVYGGTTGSGSAVGGLSTGTGDAGHFEVLNNASAGEGVSATTNGSGTAVYGQNTGTGRAGYFYISATSNNHDALEARTKGSARAGTFVIDNIANLNAALLSTTNGAGWAVLGVNDGTGGAGHFGIWNSNNTQHALEALTNGTGSAVDARNSFSGIGTTYGVWGQSNSSTGRGVAGYAAHSTGVNYGVRGGTASPNGYGVFSTADLHVQGDISASGSKAGYVADTVLNDDTEPLEPGDVVEITGVADPVQGDIPVMRVRKVRTEGSTAVLGPVDCALDVAPMEEEPEIMGRKPGKGKMHAHRKDGEVPAGGYGRVVTLGAFRTVKVDTSQGAIRPGDLLVSSSRPGYAMAATHPEVGTVIGKALGALPAGTGEIAIFVSPR